MNQNCQPSSVRMTEALASEQPAWFGFQMWRKVDLDPIKQEQIVIVRGKIQTKVSVEPEAVDNSQDQEAIKPMQSDAKAVYLERIQTVRFKSSPSHHIRSSKLILQCSLFM